MVDFVNKIGCLGGGVASTETDSKHLKHLIDVSFMIGAFFIKDHHIYFSEFKTYFILLLLGCPFFWCLRGWKSCFCANVMNDEVRVKLLKREIQPLVNVVNSSLPLKSHWNFSLLLSILVLQMNPRTSHGPFPER